MGLGAASAGCVENTYTPKYSTLGGAMAYICSSTKTTVLEQLVNLIRDQLDEAEAESAIVFSTDSDASPSPQDLVAIEARVLEVSRSWDDEFQTRLIESLGNEEGGSLARQFRGAFPIAYRARFSPRQALADIQQVLRLADGAGVSLGFYQANELPADELRFKLVCPGEPLVLSDVIPMLENLGMRVLSEHPYTLECPDGGTYGISDFRVSCPASGAALETGKRMLQRAIEPIWQGRVENDLFNQLIVRAGMDWREVALLRAYARYMKQLRFGISQHFIADTLARHLNIAQLLVSYFRARFEPEIPASERRQAVLERLERELIEALDQVETLDDDRILRRFLVLMKATLRTNYYQRDEQGEPKGYFSFKLEPSVIPDIPQPRPRFEIFVYSPRIEGVHLRAGRIARGGLRWSDRIEDYRTEVLGLVKAQQVKNSVIVPAGAKGCFIVKQPPQEGGREALQAEGIACYQTFIRGLLDLADNLAAGQVVAPADVVRHDEDDPYLVVAADKGTATFSDIANRISAEYGFWLGDAFASGGSDGYDHKKMGITARGAWESVKRHFRERGLDTQTQAFTAVGIGDMGGDVFGNGMLLSDRIRLVGAFNHQHIFVDPAPDEALSFHERQRLFALPRSSWTDYDASLISKGGGVFSRAAKWIPLSDEMRALLQVDAVRLTPNELIQALLTAPVDLLWNGGIGTYIKAREESHEAVGDKSNDSLRINAEQLRCQVLGEGGNLGATQRGRIEFARAGGAANTDFIDNAGGVDCSDHEVNIKILLNERVQQGEMSLAERNQMLRDMTPEVAELVLSNNYRQAFALSVATAAAAGSLDDQLRFIKRLEDAGKLDRALECLPGDDELQQRRGNGTGLTRPELSVLICYAKIELKQALVHSWIAQDLRYSRALHDAFPPSLREAFPEAIDQHRLRAEISSTQIANDLVNRMGITWMDRMRDATGAEPADIAASYLIACQVFDVDRRWAAIEALDGRVMTAVQIELMGELTEQLTRGSHWLLQHCRQDLDPDVISQRYRAALEQVMASPEALGSVIPKERWHARYSGFADQGVPEPLALYCASAESRYWLMDIIDLSVQLEQPLVAVAEVYFSLGEGLSLTWLDRQMRAFRADSHWQQMAVIGFRNELDHQLRVLTSAVFELDREATCLTPEIRIQHWRDQQAGRVARWQRTLSDMQGSTVIDCAVLLVAQGVLRELAS